MIDFHRVTRTSLGQRVRTVLATVLGFGSTGDDANAETAEDCEVIQPLGLVARPALGDGHDVEAVILREPDETIVLGFVHKNSTLHTVQAGATELYSDKEPTCRIVLHANGDIAITAKSGQNIVLNGGTNKAARVTDPVRIGTLAGANGGGAVSFTFTPFNADGTPGTPEVSTTVTIAGVISNAGGAANVKA